MSRGARIRPGRLGLTLGLMILAAAPVLRAQAANFAGSGYRATGLVPVSRQPVYWSGSDYRSWKFSLAPLIASHSLDVASSWNMRELNPLLADQRGGFGMKAAGIKFGAVGAFVGVQYLLVRKYPKTARVFSKMNWATAAVTTGFAVHNFAIR